MKPCRLCGKELVPHPIWKFGMYCPCCPSVWFNRAPYETGGCALALRDFLPEGEDPDGAERTNPTSR